MFVQYTCIIHDNLKQHIFITYILGMIEKNSWQGLEDFFSALARSLHIEAEETVHLAIKRKSRRRRAPSISRPCLIDKRPIPRGTCFLKINKCAMFILYCCRFSHQCEEELLSHIS